MNQDESPSFCNYDQSNYQNEFWGDGKRDYEDGSEEIALKRMLPKSGNLMLEIGAGAGRNTLRYTGYKRIVLMDYALTQMQQAQKRLGKSDRFIYVAADVYHLPFTDNLFDGSTMIRVLHHLSEIDPAIGEIQRVMQEGSTFILEFANKRNLKSILRYLTGKQKWNPFTKEQVEFVKLNFDNHPDTVAKSLSTHGFRVQKTLAVSNLRIGTLKKKRNLGWMLKVESALQIINSHTPLSPSVFMKCIQTEDKSNAGLNEFFRCPNCGGGEINETAKTVECISCGREYPIVDGIYDFRL
ncbi:MAG: methyltransferase domain-containing protein [Flexilinea sp.]